jgi:hypothetical protein
MSDKEESINALQKRIDAFKLNPEYFAYDIRDAELDSTVESLLSGIENEVNIKVNFSASNPVVNEVPTKQVSTKQVSKGFNRNLPSFENDPVSVFDFIESLARQSGRTDAIINAIGMLKSIDKFMVITHSLGVSNYLKRLLTTKYGYDVIDTGEFKTATSQEQAVLFTRGFTGPVYIDHCAFYVWNRNFLKQCNLGYYHIPNIGV